MIRLVALVALALALAAPAMAQERVVAIGGSLTEIAFALGAGDRVVARDSTSNFPEAAGSLPDIGYMRALSPEGVLSAAPDLILALEGAGPPEAMEVLAATGLRIVTIPDTPGEAGILAKIRDTGAALGREAEAADLAATVADDLAAARAMAADAAGSQPKRVMFILSLQGGRVLAAGSDTGAAAMIGMAGAVNAFDGFSGYKPVSDEAILAAAPEAILMMDRGDGHEAGLAELAAIPALAATPALASGAVIRMDGLYLLGFGPRTAAAIRDLATALYGA